MKLTKKQIDNLNDLHDILAKMATDYESVNENKGCFIGDIIESFAGYCGCLADDQEYRSGTLAGLVHSISRDLGKDPKHRDVAKYLIEEDLE